MIFVTDVTDAMSSSCLPVCAPSVRDQRILLPLLALALEFDRAAGPPRLKHFSGTDELAVSCCRVSLISLITSPLQFGMLTNRLGLENKAAFRNNFVVKLQSVEHR